MKSSTKVFIALCCGMASLGAVFIATIPKSGMEGDVQNIASLNAFKDDLTSGQELMDRFLNQAADTLARNVDSAPLNRLEDYYYRDAIGVFGNHKKTLPSNVYVNAGVEITPQLRAYLSRTDYLGKSLDR